MTHPSGNEASLALSRQAPTPNRTRRSEFDSHAVKWWRCEIDTVSIGHGVRPLPLPALLAVEIPLLSFVNLLLPRGLL